VLMAIGASAEAEPATPDTAGLYGGEILWVETLDLGDNQSRVFVSTRSANSIYYTDIDHNQDNPFSDVRFQIVPDLGAEGGFGELYNFSVDQASGYLYFPWFPPMDPMTSNQEEDQQQGIYKCTVEEGSISLLEFDPQDEDKFDKGPGRGLGWVNSITIHNGTMLFVEQTWNEQTQTDMSQLRFGVLDEITGNFTESDGSPVPLKNGNSGQLRTPVVNPVNNMLYFLDTGDHWEDRDIDSAIYKSSAALDSLNSSTTFTKIIPPAGSDEYTRQYESIGIGPDGVIFLAGSQQTQKGHHESVVVYSGDDGTSWQTGERDEYNWAWQGPNFAFVDNGDGGYDVITGTMISEDGGAFWGMLPRGGNVWPHPGSIAFDPNADNTFYVQTDRGVAVTTDAGYSFTRAWERPEHSWIEDIEIIDLGDDKSGIYIRERKQNDNPETNNPNEIYYAEIDHSSDTPTYGDFAAVPGMGDNSNWEVWSRFTGDATSGYIFFEGTPDQQQGELNGLYKTNGITEPTLVEIETGYASRPLIYDGYMFYVDSSWGGGYWVDGYWVDGSWEGEPQLIEAHEDADGNSIESYWTQGETWVDGYQVEGYWVEGESASKLYYGTLDADGNFTLSGQTNISEQAGLWPERMVIDPSDNTIYIMSNNWETGAQIYKSSDSYNAISETNTFSKIETPAETDGSYQWQAFGVGPDGQLYLGGWEQSGMGGNVIAYQEIDGESWETVTPDNGYSGIGDEFAFIGNADVYDVFCGTMASKNKGIAWENLPRKDEGKAYPNSSSIQIDPNNPDVMYIPTSRGMGYSSDAGNHFYEISKGIEAVHIKDLVLDPITGNGWAVASSGVYRVYDFNNNPTWSAPMDPHGEGATYNVVDMDLNDPTGNTVYVGTEWGDQIFKTTDGGVTWKHIWRPQPQFEQSELPDQWGWPNWCGNVSAIQVDPGSRDRIFVGYNTGWLGWGDNQADRVFGQLWVYEAGSGQMPEPDPDKPFWGPGQQQDRDWTQILLTRSEDETREIIANVDENNNNTWYSLKGDANIHDILITEENGETVIYVAASYSDESVTPVTDERLIHEGLYDSYGYPLVYRIYRITGDVDSGLTVETDFAQENTAISALAIDSAGNIYGNGKNYDEATYESFLNRYISQAKVEMAQREEEKMEDEFYSEAEKGLYDELVYRLFEQGQGFDPSYMGDWDGHFQEVYGEFSKQYFANYEGELNDEFESYFDQSFDTFFNQWLVPKFNENKDENTQHFDDFWDHNKPAPGLRIVYKRDISGNWKALPFDGLNKAFNMHWGFDHNKATITIGQDPQNSEAEVPYVAFNRFIYYMPDGYNDWVLGNEYPLGTEIYVIIGVTSQEASDETADEDETLFIEDTSANDSALMSALRTIGLAPQKASAATEVDNGAYLYVGTGTGIYGQFITPSAEGYSNVDSATTTIPWTTIIAIVGVIAATGAVLYLKKNVF